MSEIVDVFVADDHAIIAAGLAALLSTVGSFRVVGQVQNGADLMRSLGARPAALLLLDLNMPGVSGATTVSALRTAFPKLRIVILTANADAAMAQLLLDAGASGYVIKNDDGDELLHALEVVMTGQRYASAGLQLTHDDHQVIQGLTARERQLLVMIGDGRRNAEIATMLGITVATARKHRENLRRKLNAHSGAQLAALAVASGLSKQFT